MPANVGWHIWYLVDLDSVICCGSDWYHHISDYFIFSDLRVALLFYCLSNCFQEFLSSLSLLVFPPLFHFFLHSQAAKWNTIFVFPAQFCQGRVLSLAFLILLPLLLTLQQPSTTMVTSAMLELQQIFVDIKPSKHHRGMFLHNYISR